MRHSFPNLQKGALAAAAFLSVFAYTPAPANANLGVTPTIVVMQGRDRFADVNLLNTGNEVRTYEMGWLFYSMTEGTGSYKPVGASLTEFDLSKNLVLSPRRVMVAPGESQKLRLGLRLQGEPPAPGDYRAHLEMRPLPIDLRTQPPAGQRGSKIGIGVNVGFSIPVIYRVGESTATASIGDVGLQTNAKNGRIEVVVPVTRSEGPYGILGHIEIFYGDRVVGEVKNANIFPEIKSRRFVVPLSVDKLSGGSLRIALKTYDKKSKKIYAEKTLPVSK